MPLKGILCADPNYKGLQLSFDECLSCAANRGPRKCQYPYQVIRAMARNTDERKDAGLSTTNLTDNCPRKVILASEHDYCESPKDYIPRFRGTLTHLLIEEYTDDGIGPHISEVRLRKAITVNLDGELVEVMITGKFDLVLLDHKLVVDFKSCESVHDEPLKYGIPKHEHIEQVNIYKWLLWGGEVVSINERASTHIVQKGEVIHIEVNEGGIQYVDQFDMRKVAAPIWPMEQIEAYLRERATPFAIKNHRGVLPPIMRDPVTKRRHVLCSYCPLKAVCDSYGA